MIFDRNKLHAKAIFAAKKYIDIISGHYLNGKILSRLKFLTKDQRLFMLSFILLAPHGALAVIAFRYSPTLLPSPPIFSKYSPQTSQNQSLEEA